MKPERLADEELMPLIAARDPDALEVVYDRHGGAAYSLAYRIVGERAAAEDVVQEAFISIWRSGARYDRARGSVRSWMLGVVRNRAIDLLRSKTGRARLDFDDDTILEQRVAGERTEEEAEQRETADEVRGAIGELPRDQSKVIELAYFGGFSHSEIAEMLSVPLGTVKGRMRLGLEKMRSELAEGLSMSEADHTRWKDDVAAYALGALEPGEALELERHLDDCAECRAELRWLRPAVDLLPSSVERVEPPLELRAKILDQARSEPGPAASSAERSASGRRGWLSGWRPVAAVGRRRASARRRRRLRDPRRRLDRRCDDHGRRRQAARGYGQAGDGGRLRDPAPRQRRRDAAEQGPRGLGAARRRGRTVRRPLRPRSRRAGDRR